MGKSNQVAARLGLWDYEKSVKPQRSILQHCKKQSRVVRELISPRNLQPSVEYSILPRSPKNVEKSSCLCATNLLAAYYTWEKER